MSLTRGMRAAIIRDIPAPCVCLWDWDELLQKWVRVSTVPGCPNHER